jgi:enolase-phosphatase E1
MTASLQDLNVSAILLDIEGTTTPLRFVYDVLFPYARTHSRRFLAEHVSSPEVLADVAGLRSEHAEDIRKGLDPPELQEPSPEAQVDSLVAYIHWLMDRDRKTTPLKSLQGKIWEDGYRTGRLRGEVFDDVPPAFKRWREQGREVQIFSSGSVLAQKLLFAHTTVGDLTGFIRAYFDTGVGAKTEPASYQRIAVEGGHLSSQVLFISDLSGELDAAASAGMRTLLCVRPGNLPQPEATPHSIIHTFENICP